MNVEHENDRAPEGEEGPAPHREGVLVPPAPEAAPPQEAAAPEEQAQEPAAEEQPEPEREASEPEPEPEEPPAPPPPPLNLEEVQARLRRHHVSPAMIAVERIDEDRTFQIRPEGDISLLATDIARLGQLFPVDIRLKPPDRFQIISGFRRVAALRFLQRDRVAARLHTDLTDEDALLMALVSAIHAQPVEPEDLEAVRDRLEQQGRLTPAIRSMLEKALAPEDDLAPETVGEQEIDADELAADVTLRLGEINQDLSLLADAFDSLDAAKQEELLQQLRYSSELVAYLEGRR